jgi:hypothetical protein
MHILALSYNQPKLPSNATWCENGTTFVDNSIIGGAARGIFVKSDDTVYVAAHAKNQILVWSKDSIGLTRNLTVKLPDYTSLFVTMNGDIYFENGNEEGRIDKWTTSSASSIVAMKFSRHCYGLFIDINNTLYCSMKENNRVVKASLDGKNATEITVAGTGSSGSKSNELDMPWGIFVNTNFDLYVADPGNSRIQFFRPGELNGTTVAGNGIQKNLTLNFPTDVMLDADGYLYIADNHNGRVIRSKGVEFQCVIGCSGRRGSAPNELKDAYSIRFDSQSNLYVADEHSNRIQKFTLATSSCGKFDRDTDSNTISNSFGSFDRTTFTAINE